VTLTKPQLLTLWNHRLKAGQSLFCLDRAHPVCIGKSTDCIRDRDRVGAFVAAFSVLLRGVIQLALLPHEPLAVKVRAIFVRTQRLQNFVVDV
jgi:hypothetical protein